MQRFGVRCILTFVVIAILVVLAGTALAQEGGMAPPVVQVPALYYGSVVDQSGNIVKDGIVKAYVENEFCGQLGISGGQYGMPADDPEVRRLLVYSLVNDLTGKTVDFRIRVGSVEYTALSKPEEVIWETRSKQQVDLVMTGTVAPYNDMQEHWAGDTVQRLAAAGIISGYEDYNFRPENTVSRAECAVMLMRAVGSGDVSSDLSAAFADRAEIPAWAVNHVAEAVQSGLIKGYPGEAGAVFFRPDGSVTRAEWAAIVSRVKVKTELVDNQDIVFSDQEQIPGWAAGEIKLAVQKGLITGYPDGTFKPENKVTRAEAATIVARLLDNLK
ncbi:MAG: Cellulosome-anchoring protein precursor [Pelotomaculum sp. PtaB.Bin104]|nr:MAG: Cellulosome-anchoring protein precursor [Pelotomaculum sp. PtaB.Bin104]